MSEPDYRDPFCTETNYAKRKKLLDKKIEEEGLTEENELRRKVFQRRYSTRRDDNSGKPADIFLRGYLQLGYYRKNSPSKLFRRREQKEFQEILKGWQVEECRAHGEVGEKVLSEELFNMMMTYITLCKSDRTFSSYIMGMIAMGDAALTAKIREDINETAVRVPERFGWRDQIPELLTAADAVLDLLKKSGRAEEDSGDE